MMYNKVSIVVVFGVLITTACIVTDLQCKQDSSNCLASWWDTRRYTENRLSWEHDRGCYNITLAGKTMFGDTVQAWSSLYFALALPFMREKSVWFVLMTGWLASSSFVFHATYAATAHTYDIIGVRIFALSILIDLMFNEIMYTKSGIFLVRRIFLFLLRGMLVMSAGYIAYRHWENGYKHYHEYFQGRKWTHVWVAVPSTMIFVYFIINFFFVKKGKEVNNRIKRQWKQIIASCISIVLGISLLALEEDEICHKVSQMLGKHYYGHLFTGIGVAIFASLDVWKPFQTYMKIVETDLGALF